MVASSGATIKELLIQRARTCIGVSIYRRNASLEQAPKLLNCFRFTQWLWASVGVHLPDHQLAWSSAESVALSDVGVADLMFVPRLNYTLEEDDFGHVGITTDAATVVHATKWRNTVVEEPVEIFLSRGCLGVRRIPARYYCRS